MIAGTTAQIIASLIAFGMALAFFIADRDAPTSRALSFCLFAIGLDITLRSQVENPLLAGGAYPEWGGVFALPQVLAFYFAHEWILRVRRTIPAGRLNTRVGDTQLRVGQGLALFYGMLAMFYPHVRAEQFLDAAFRGVQLSGGFFLFAVPLGVSLALGIAGGLITLNRRPDVAERKRLVAFALGAPFMASGIITPATAAPVLTSIGLIVFLVGGVQYHVIQGRRAQFLSRFLAPQVAQLVRDRGLKTATRHQTLEISVVCTDLRGFTAVSVDTDSQQVIQVLREYYDMVGSAVAGVGGTIKDQAGDGVLVLVGAPIWTPDHAARAIDLAHRIRSEGIELSRRWSECGLGLGVGVGVATGFVTVGVIGAASRLEYTAVGSAVNLASRLCSEAMHAEVLVDQRTQLLLEHAPAQWRFNMREPLALKGFAQPVGNFSLALP